MNLLELQKTTEDIVTQQITHQQQPFNSDTQLANNESANKSYLEFQSLYQYSMS